MARKLEAYPEDRIRARLAEELPGWSYEDDTIRRSYATDGWPTTLLLVNHIGFLAEAADHHPDLAVSWSSVEVRLSTHHAGGITDKDFELARKFEESALWRPPEDGALVGTKREFVKGA